MAVDYADFVFHDGISFLAAGLAGGAVSEALPDSAIGSLVFRVACEFSAFTASGRIQPPPLSADSSGFLPAGTPVHRVRGFAPSCRLTARRAGRWIAYLAQHDVNHVSATVPCALRPTP